MNKVLMITYYERL